MKKIVIFTATRSYSVRRGIRQLLDSFPTIELMLVEHRPKRETYRLLKNQWVNLKRHGWRWIPYQAGELISRCGAALVREPFCLGRRPGETFRWESIAGDSRVTWLGTEDIHAEATLRAVRQFAPELGISLAAPILKPALYELPLLGTINLHKGKVPDYRGMPPAFWELYYDEEKIGCTIHRVERTLDAGPILLQREIVRRTYSTLRGLQLALDELGVDMTCEAVHQLMNGSPVWSPQLREGRTFRRPMLFQEAELAKRLTPSGELPLRRLAKTIIFWLYIKVIRPFPRRILAMRKAQRVIVLLYHRVNDDMRDSLTVGIAQFDQQMAWLAGRYSVVSIEDVIKGDLPRNTSRPLISVTFDDGYLDNYENAVPILLRHGVPAAFFVSTGIIGTDAGFPHDLSKKGYVLPAMDWHQLLHMKELGFVIGSHSVTHLDCGQADLNTVRGELIQSRNALQERLGINELIFAYPFGGRQNMTPAALQVVKDVGYVGCLSAYGRYAKGPIDPYNVERTGIDHNFTLWAFRARLEGFE